MPLYNVAGLQYSQNIEGVDLEKGVKVTPKQPEIMITVISLDEDPLMKMLCMVIQCSRQMQLYQNSILSWYVLQHMSI